MATDFIECCYEPHPLKDGTDFTEIHSFSAFGHLTWHITKVFTSVNFNGLFRILAVLVVAQK